MVHRTSLSSRSLTVTVMCNDESNGSELLKLIRDGISSALDEYGSEDVSVSNIEVQDSDCDDDAFERVYTYALTISEGSVRGIRHDDEIERKIVESVSAKVKRLLSGRPHQVNANIK